MGVGGKPPNHRKDVMDAMLNTFQLAHYLGKTPEAIRMMRFRGLGPKGTKIGRNVLYRRSDIDAWLNAREIAEATASRNA